MSSVAASARWALLACLVLTTSCASPGAADDPRYQFGIVTIDGTVLEYVEGSVTGYTNAELTDFVRKGVGEAYVVRRGVSLNATPTGRQMVWHVINDGRKPTVVITVHLVRDGKIIRTAFTGAPAPDASPEGYFIAAISQLTQEVLPPLATNPVSSRNGPT